MGRSDRKNPMRSGNPNNDGDVLIDLNEEESQSSESGECEEIIKEAVPIKIVPDDDWFVSLPEKERNWYEHNVTTFEELDAKSIVCTSCFKQANHRNIGDILRHPTLNVPICKSCKNFYFDGAWTKDSEGSFEYCGWWAQGGELLLCGDNR